MYFDIFMELLLLNTEIPWEFLKNKLLKIHMLKMREWTGRQRGEKEREKNDGRENEREGDMERRKEGGRDGKGEKNKEIRKEGRRRKLGK